MSRHIGVPRRLAMIVALSLSAVAVGFCAAGMARAATKPILLIVHGEFCGPCRQLDAAYLTDPAFRRALQERFELRTLRWEVPAERSHAEQLGVSRLPAFVVSDGGKTSEPVVGFIPTAVGKQTLLRELTELLELATPPVKSNPPRPAPQQPERTAPAVPQPVSPVPADAADHKARRDILALASQSRDLEAAQNKTQQSVEQLQTDVAGVKAEVADVKSEVTRSTAQLSQQLQQSQESTRSDVSRITDQLRQTIQQSIDRRTSEPATPRPALPGISTEISAGESTGIGGWLLKAGLTGAAAYFGLPIGAAAIVAGGVSWIVSRRRGRRGKAAGAAASGGFPAAGGTVLPREYSEAVELLQLAEREGRLPIHEALRGTMAGDEIDKLCEHADPVTRQLGTNLRDRIAQRFNEVAPISQKPQSF